MSEAILTMGIDIGVSSVKGVIIKYEPINGNLRIEVLSKYVNRIRKRHPEHVAKETVNVLLKMSGLSGKDIAYIASTGEGEALKEKNGHFYSMTTHARGGIFLIPGAKVVVDGGALYVRVMKVNEKGRVLDYTMTNQCASGSGQFIENIARYLGLTIEEAGEVSLKATSPADPSGICAVLAETDVINFVSRGIPLPDIMMGIHLSIAGRIARLISKIKPEFPIAFVGGMGLNIGMVEALRKCVKCNDPRKDIVTHPDAIYSGALGAAIWGGYRFFKLKEKKKTHSSQAI